MCSSATRTCAPGIAHSEGLRAGGNNQVAAIDAVRCPGAILAIGTGAPAEQIAKVSSTAPPFCAKPVTSSSGHLPAVDVSGHGEIADTVLPVPPCR